MLRERFDALVADDRDGDSDGEDDGDNDALDDDDDHYSHVSDDGDVDADDDDDDDSDAGRGRGRGTRSAHGSRPWSRADGSGEPGVFFPAYVDCRADRRQPANLDFSAEVQGGQAESGGKAEGKGKDEDNIYWPHGPVSPWSLPPLDFGKGKFKGKGKGKHKGWPGRGHGKGWPGRGRGIR